VLSRAAIIGFGFVIIGASLVPNEPTSRAKAWIAHAEYLDQVGVRRQLASADCGVAAMEMVLEKLSGRYERFDSLRKVTIARRDGVSFAELRAFAAERGFRALGWHMRRNDLYAARLPAIVQFPDHFVVLDSISHSGEVILRDPAIGRVRMTAHAFDRAWTGRILLFELALPAEAAH